MEILGEPKHAGGGRRGVWLLIGADALLVFQKKVEAARARL